MRTLWKQIEDIAAFVYASENTQGSMRLVDVMFTTAADVEAAFVHQPDNAVEEGAESQESAVTQRNPSSGVWLVYGQTQLVARQVENKQ